MASNSARQARPAPIDETTRTAATLMQAFAEVKQEGDFARAY